MNSTLDILWVAVSSALVLLMQAGFLCVEAGATRRRNAINVAIKNIADLGLTVIMYWAVGYGLMYGASLGGWIGIPTGPAEPQTPVSSMFFVFQAMFCGTAVTIVSGAVAERLRFGSYLAIAGILGVLIYPTVGHWAWASDENGASGWLGRLGFVDFAGSSVVHSVGGWASLATLLLVGPRTGRFGDERSAASPMHASNITLTMLGAMILWFGWLGFNGGSALGFDDRVPGILLVTLMGGASGTLTGIVWGRLRYGFHDPMAIATGCIAGLVAITAGCHAYDATSAVVVAGLGAVIASLATDLLERLKIDDAVQAIPAHLAAGIWGTLAVAGFGDLEALGTSLDRADLFLVQLLGVASIAGAAFLVPLLLLRLMAVFRPLRITDEEEARGLNAIEHRVEDEITRFVNTIQEQERTQDLSLRADVESLTDIGVIANQYNILMDRLQASKTDVTVLREVQVQLDEAWRQAEAANVAKGAFLASMSHELRTPLTAILGYAEILADPTAPAETRDRCLPTIQASGEHLLSIVNDILDLSKIEAGKLTVQRGWTDLGTLVFELDSMLRRSAEQKGLELRFELAKPVPKQVLTDTLRLRQILTNLIGNAIKFTAHGSVRVVVDCAADPARLEVTVIDTGIGLTTEQQERLFRPYVQAGPDTYRRFGGTGLGLTISKHLAEMLGGDITVTSTPHEGSRFRLCIDPGDVSRQPLLDSLRMVQRKRSSDQGGASVPKVSLSGLRVLLVDDGADNRRLVQFHLERAGATIQTAENGRSGLELALSAERQGQPFDVILMDMQMPIMNGYEATEQLRRCGYSRPIVALTASAMVEDRDRCLAAGCDDFVSKPLRQDSLLDALTRQRARVPQPQ